MCSFDYLGTLLSVATARHGLNYGLVSLTKPMYNKRYFFIKILFTTD